MLLTKAFTTEFSINLHFYDLDEFPVLYDDSKGAQKLSDVFWSMFKNETSMAGLRLPTKYFNIKQPTLPVSLNNHMAETQLTMQFTKCVVRPERVFEQGELNIFSLCLGATTEFD